MTIITYKQACIFGGTGFIGRYIVRELAKAGYRVKVATRAPERAYQLRVAGMPGQIVPFACNYRDEASLRQAVHGCNLVINCVGILYEKGRNSFTFAHTELPRAIAKACKAEHVARFIHISALACDRSSSHYARSKYAGELAILENFPQATILRPSVVFGTEDNFFNLFARLSTILPALPLIGGGETRFQPVYVCDVAQAVLNATYHPEAQGRIYELGGPEILTFRQIYEKIFEQTGIRRALVPLPWSVASLQGVVMGLLPSPLLTADQVKSLKTDNIVQPEALTLQDLGVFPTAPDVILPTYLSRYRPGGRFGDKKRA
jgi:uncharacterized protein YbjT (DUF2867 family)